MRTLQEWIGHRDHTTTFIYADFAPDPTGGAAFAERAFGLAAAQASRNSTPAQGPRSGAPASIDRPGQPAFSLDHGEL
jgi:hypothetical protein